MVLLVCVFCRLVLLVELLAEVFMTLFANVELAANNVGTNSKHFHVRVLPEVYLKHQSSYPYF